MPISKNSKKLVCVNECGRLDLQVDKNVEDFDSYSLTEVTGNEEQGKHINTNRVYTVNVFRCPKCGYIELYDKE